MGYISKDQVKKIREDLKAAFPNFKFSVVMRDYSSVNVIILSAPIELRTDTTKTYESVNLYWLETHCKEHPALLEVLTKISDIMDQFQGEPYETSDYGMQPTYYTNLSIGNWEKPFQVTEKKSKLSKTSKIKVQETITVVSKFIPSEGEAGRATC